MYKTEKEEDEEEKEKRMHRIYAKRLQFICSTRIYSKMRVRLVVLTLTYWRNMLVYIHTTCMARWSKRRSSTVVYMYACMYIHVVKTYITQCVYMCSNIFFALIVIYVLYHACPHIGTNIYSGICTIYSFTYENSRARLFVCCIYICKRLCGVHTLFEYIQYTKMRIWNVR